MSHVPYLVEIQKEKSTKATKKTFFYISTLRATNSKQTKKKNVSILHQKFVNYSQGRVQPAEGEEEQGKRKALKVEMKQKKRRKRGFLLIPSGKLKVMNVFIF